MVAALIAANPYTPTSALAQATMAASWTLSELVVVREWLYELRHLHHPQMPRQAIGASQSTA